MGVGLSIVEVDSPMGYVYGLKAIQDSYERIFRWHVWEECDENDLAYFEDRSEEELQKWLNHRLVASFELTQATPNTLRLFDGLGDEYKIHDNLVIQITYLAFVFDRIHCLEESGLIDKFSLHEKNMITRLKEEIKPALTGVKEYVLEWVI